MIKSNTVFSTYPQSWHAVPQHLQNLLLSEYLTLPPLRKILEFQVMFKGLIKYLLVSKIRAVLSRNSLLGVYLLKHMLPRMVVLSSQRSFNLLICQLYVEVTPPLQRTQLHSRPKTYLHRLELAQNTVFFLLYHTISNSFLRARISHRSRRSSILLWSIF